MRGLVLVIACASLLVPAWAAEGSFERPNAEALQRFVATMHPDTPIDAATWHAIDEAAATLRDMDLTGAFDGASQSAGDVFLGGDFLTVNAGPATVAAGADIYACALPGPCLDHCWSFPITAGYSQYFNVPSVIGVPAGYHFSWTVEKTLLWYYLQTGGTHGPSREAGTSCIAVNAPLLSVVFTDGVLVPQ